MGKQTHYGKPTSYPYYFRAFRGKKLEFVSGTFKTRTAAKEAAKDYCKDRLSHKIIDRRKRG